MKKLYKVLATAFAPVLVLAAPQTVLTSHASSLYGDGIGFNIDAKEHSGSYGDQTPMADPDAGSSSSSNSSSSTSYDGGFSSSDSYDSGIGFNAEASEHSYSYGDQSPMTDPDGGSATVAAPKRNSNDVTVGVTGGQKFRLVMAGDHKSFQVYHCGISRVTYVVGGADGTGVAYKTASLEKGEDGLWYVNIIFEENTDTTGYAVGMTKGDANYLNTELGVSGIKLNGTLALSTVPAQISGMDTDEADVTPGDSEKVANYHCNCGYSVTDYEALKQHMLQHVLKGETNSYCTTYE